MIAASCGTGSDSTEPVDAGSAPTTFEAEPTPAVEQSEDSVTAAASTTTPPSTTTSPPDTTIPEPRRIIPLDGDLAEIVFALGLGDEVVATDISATYPAAADALPEIGYQRALAPEPIIEFEPTVVLATEIAGPPETLDALGRVGVDVVMIPTEATAAGPGEKIRAVAAALDAEAVGDELAASVDAGIQEVVDATAAFDTAPRVAAMYVRGQNTQLLFGAETGVGWLLEAVGAVNVADDLGVAETAQVTAESFVAAAPEVIVLPTAGLASVGGIDGLLEIPGVAQTPAGANRRILTYEDQYLLGNGPRTPALLRELVADLYPGAGDAAGSSTGATP